MRSTLPVEIQYQICESLVVNDFSDGSYNPRTLNSLLRCSTQLKSVAQPLLYSAVGVYSTKRAALLKRTCGENATLARHIYHLDVVLHGCDQCRERGCENCMSDIIGDLLEELPNLRHLNITAYTSLGKIAQVFDRVIDLDLRSSGAQGPLHNLAKLEVDLDHHSYDFDMNDLLLPTVKDLTIYNCRSGRYDWDLDVSDLHRLVLTRCELSVNGIFSLLSACSNLRHVQYQWIQDCWFDDEFDNGGRDLAPRVVDGLLLSRTTLQHLDISGESSLFNNSQGLGDLTVFPCLTSLKAPLLMLCEVIDNTPRVCRLPACLRHLEIYINHRSSGAHETTALQKLAELVRDVGRSPGLQSIVLTKDTWMPWTWSASLDVLKHASTERGITMEYGDLSHTNYGPRTILRQASEIQAESNIRSVMP